MLEWRPAFGTLIGAQIVLSTAFWVWAKLLFSRHRHRFATRLWRALPKCGQATF